MFVNLSDSSVRDVRGLPLAMGEIVLYVQSGHARHCAEPRREGLHTSGPSGQACQLGFHVVSSRAPRSHYHDRPQAGLSALLNIVHVERISSLTNSNLSSSYPLTVLFTVLIFGECHGG
jgi:hypothetical protein